MRTVPRELVVDHVLVELQPAHAQRFHDLIGAIAGVDDDDKVPPRIRKPSVRTGGFGGSAEQEEA